MPIKDDPRFADGEVYLRTYLSATDEEWSDGFDDALSVSGDDKWNRIMVAKADVAERWPFGLAHQDTSSDGSWKTGAPGRPSAMNMVREEYRQRELRGEARKILSVEAEWLADWIKRKDPRAPSCTAKTIENAIRNEHRASHPII